MSIGVLTKRRGLFSEVGPGAAGGQGVGQGVVLVRGWSAVCAAVMVSEAQPTVPLTQLTICKDPKVWPLCHNLWSNPDCVIPS